jgi:hypothetical protein
LENNSLGKAGHCNTMFPAAKVPGSRGSSGQRL